VSNECYYVAVIGAGPAGMFAARELARNGAKVVIFNRDIKPGGLAEYGIYLDKYAMKEGLRTQFKQVLDTPGLTYYGNLTVGTKGDLTLDDLRSLGFQAILVTVGPRAPSGSACPANSSPAYTTPRMWSITTTSFRPTARNPSISAKRSRWWALAMSCWILPVT